MQTRVSFLLILVLMLPLAAGARGPDKKSVQVRDGRVRETPSFLGRIVASVQYGDRVEIVEEKDVWTRVRTAQGRSGWIHTSALTEKRIVLQSSEGDVQTGASGDELALAGKGFNSDVEAEFKAENKDIDYTWVDRMETWTVDPLEIQVFLVQGGVEPLKGGAE